MGIPMGWSFGTCVWQGLFLLAPYILCDEKNWGNTRDKDADTAPASIDLLARHELFFLRPW